MSLLSKLFGSKPDVVAWIDTDDLDALLLSEVPPAVIDVRGPGEFTGPLGHIPSARNIPLDRIQDETAGLLAETRPLVFVCHTDRRSAAAAEFVRRAGGTQLAVLGGGMVAWRSRPGSAG